MRLFLYLEKDSIANGSVKTPLNSVDFTIFKSTSILAARDFGFSFAKFMMADQCEATEGELNFHTRCTEAREIKISAISATKHGSRNDRNYSPP